MIWNSVLLMTLIDLTIIGMVIAMLTVATRQRLLGGRSTATLCLAAGMLVLGLFYLTDLLVMHIVPAFIGQAQAMQLMETLHLDVAWITALIFVGLLFAAFLNFSKEKSRAERHMSLLSEMLPMAVAYIDANERVRYANALYAKWHGRSREEILGRRVQDYMAPEIYELLRPHIRSALMGAESGFEGVLTLEYSDIPLDIRSRLVPDRDETGIRGFYAVISDVTHENELERQVVGASERERNAIGQDLHDNLGQILTGASLKLQALAHRPGAINPEDMEAFNDIAATLGRSIADTRRLARVLAPAVDGGGITAALRSLATESSRLLDVECSVAGTGADLTTSAETAAHIYRIAQESVTNAVRHGEATHVRINFRTGGTRVELEILDDGRGIQPLPAEMKGIGIETMRYRARMIGGSLRVEPKAGGGTRVFCSCPASLFQAVQESAGAQPVEAETVERGRERPNDKDSP